MMYERIATLVPVGGAGTGRAFSIDASVDAMGMAASSSANADLWKRFGSRATSLGTRARGRRQRRHSAAW